MPPLPPPLKALHIASGDRWGGAEAQVFTLLSQLKRMPDIAVHAALLNDEELAQRLRDMDIEVTIFDERKLTGWQILLGLRKLMQRRQPHIIHTHRSKENALGALANRLSINVPNLRTSHGAPEHLPQGLRQIHKKLFAALDTFCGQYLQQRVVAVSEDLAKKLGSKFDPAKIVVIENGIDIDNIRAVVKAADFRVREPNCVHVGIAGRLDPVKRVDLFLDMAALLLKTEPNRAWRFHIFGEGALRGKLEERAHSLNITQVVTFHGHRHDIATCLAGLDALVMCSDHEGLPITPLECIVVGTPVVGHDVGGLSDILAGNAGGILTGDHSGNGYAIALLEALNHAHTDTMQTGLIRVEERFSAMNNARAIAALYHQLNQRSATIAS